MTTPQDRQDEFESALRTRRRFVPRFDEVEDAEPSPELDRIVLARARDALRPAPTPLESHDRHYRGPRWAVPLALVATVLLSFTLVMQLDPARNDTVLAPRVALPAAAPQSAAAPPPHRPLTTAPAPVQRESTAPRIEAPAPAPPAAPPPPSVVADTSIGSEAVASRVEAPAAMANSARPAAPSPPGASVADAAEVFVPSAGVRTDDAGDAASQMRTRAGSRPPELERDPQRWLQRIERLRLDGDLDAARLELDAFRRRHPDVPLPETLRGLR